MKRTREISINSTTDEMYLVEQFVEEISDEYLLGDNYFANIMVAVTEAVMNGIIHGNKADKSRKVHIHLESRKEGLWIGVTDHGDGFDHGKFASREYLLAADGENKRGILLIRSLADEVRFINKGRTIEMLFRISGIDMEVLERRHDVMHKYFRVTQETESPTQDLIT